MREPMGLLVMAYGTADGPADIERYYTDIRGGRAPSPEHLEELRKRYTAIGNRFPLLDITRMQADGLAHVLTELASSAMPKTLVIPPFSDRRYVISIKMIDVASSSSAAGASVA